MFSAPELVLERSQMLPPRPEGAPILGGWTPSPSQDTTPRHTATPSPGPGSAWGNGSKLANSSHGVLEESLFPEDDSIQNGEDTWTWEKMQENRLRGLYLAEAFDSLDGLKDVFDLEGGAAMGRYADLMLNF